MTPTHCEPNRERPLRLWPGIAAVGIAWLIPRGLPLLAPDTGMYAFLGGLGGGTLLALAWWMFFSRVPHLERWGGLALAIVGVIATASILDKSVRTVGMGILFWVEVLPGLVLALTAWAVVSRYCSITIRRGLLVAAILAACGFWGLVRADGITGGGDLQLSWRWSKTPEQRLLVHSAAEPAQTPAARVDAAPPEAAKPELARSVPSSPTAAAMPASFPAAHTLPPPAAKPMAAGVAEWPGFRGPHRDDVITGIRINTDWAASPPVEMWRKIGRASCR